MQALKEIKRLIEEVHAENIQLPQILVESESIQSIPAFLTAEALHNIVIVHDENTKLAAGNQVKDMLLRESFSVHTVELKPNQHNQVLADELSLIQLFNETPKATDVLIAVGSGTIHDIVRFVSFKMDIPFVSVPTAASVDGFTSKGAPLIFRGFKNTVQTASPIAVFADINILKRAPKELTAAGFGDIIGKYTSLLDWRISKLIANEPYNELAANLTKNSLTACVNHVDEIAAHSEFGIKVLMQSLIESGLVMLILDFSRPASGSEHHLSHYWEMELLKQDQKQLLHGAKVGVATTIIIDLYKQFFMEYDVSNIPSNWIYAQKLQEHWNIIQENVADLPKVANVREILQKVGGPSTPEELNISDALVSESLNEAIYLRDRCTGLYLMNQLQKENLQYPFLL